MTNQSIELQTQDGTESSGTRKEDGGSIERKWAVAALVLPAFSYLFVYSINVGEARHYGIPESLVTVALGDVLRVGLMAGVFGAFLIFSLRSLALDEPSHPGLREYGSPIVALLILTFLFWWSAGFDAFFWFLLTITAATTIMTVYVVVRGMRRRGSLRAVFDAAATREPAKLPLFSPRAWSLTVERALGLRPLSLIVLLVTALYLASLGSMVGRGIAQRQKRFSVSAHDQTRVVLMVRDADAVVGQIVRRGYIDEAIEVVPLADLGELVTREVGPLRPAAR